MWELKERVVIVTGGARGIGQTYVRAFMEAEARVVIADIDMAAAQELLSEFSEERHNILYLPVDVTDFESCQRMVEKVWEKWQRVDVLVNNAALYATLSRKPFYEITDAEWDRVMAVNLKGMFFCAKAVFPRMAERNYGKIINVSSTTIFRGSPFFLHYVTSKAGVVGFTRALAREVGDYGIRVNAIAPGLTVTGENDKVSQADRFAKAIADRCLKRHQFPEDLVGTVLFLSSPHSDFITGQVITVDGGANMP